MVRHSLYEEFSQLSHDFAKCHSVLVEAHRIGVMQDTDEQLEQYLKLCRYIQNEIADILHSYHDSVDDIPF